MNVITALSIADTYNQSVIRVIQHYNQAIIIAGQNGDTTVFKPFVSEKIANKMHAWIMAWHDENLRMDAKLFLFEIQHATVKDKTAKARTHERWNYQYDHPTKKGYFPKKMVDYTMEYSLFLHHGKWIIDDVKIVSEKQLPLQKVLK